MNLEQKKEKIGIVLAAGGSKGAFGAGVVEYLLDVRNKRYNVIVATSTGAMKAPFVSFGVGSRLRELYTSVEDDSIMSYSPFNKKGKLKIYRVFYNMFFRRKGSLGDNSKLLETIRKNFTEVEFRALKIKEENDVFVCVNNATKNRNEYISIKECDYKDFTEWMFISSTEPILFQNVTKNKYEYNDGAVFDYVAIEKAIKEGCTEIDVVCNHPTEMVEDTWKSSKKPVKKFLDTVLRTLEQECDATFLLNLKIGKLLADKHGVKLNFFAPPYNLEGNSMRFSKYRMGEWVKLGYTTAKIKFEEQKKLIIEKINYEK